MANHRHLGAAILGTLFATYALAADNQREVEAVQREFGTATEKADQARERSVSDLRAKATAKIIKLAERAYKENDRSAETNAWRALLGIDSSNERARKYFNDLGTLEKELKALPADAQGRPSLVFKLVGKWSGRWSNGKVFPFAIAPDGVLINSDGVSARLTREGDSLVTVNTATKCIERWTPAGDRLLLEQWYPATSFDPTRHADYFGYATREPK